MGKRLTIALWILAALSLLLVGYIAAANPVVWLETHQYLPRGFAAGMYAPLLWLADRVGCYELLIWYSTYGHAR